MNSQFYDGAWKHLVNLKKILSTHTHFDHIKYLDEVSSQYPQIQIYGHANPEEKMGDNLMTKVFTNGCFDIIHPGHLSMLKHCAAIGEHVLVGIDSDARVREMKGNNRPIDDQEARRLMLMNIKWVNEVKIFTETFFFAK